MNAHIHNLTAPDAAAGVRLDAWLAQALPHLSRARIQALMAAGMVTCHGRAVKASARVTAGMVVTLAVPPPEPAVPLPENLPLDVVYEDGDLLVLDKPAGLVVHPAPGHARGTLVNALLHHCRDLGGVGGVERPGIVHRLDKETSGLMIVAKNDASMAGLVAQFKSGAIHKGYLALVHGLPDPAEGVVETLIGRHPVERKRMAVVERNGKRALTRYRVMRRFAALALVEALIETGRTHQIRVHLAHIGHPLAGDPLYGSRGLDRILPLAPTRQMLHAARLALTHPVTGTPLAFERPPPADMRALLQRLSDAAR